MIPPREISRLAHQLSLRDKTIEKDYLLSWVLLAIANSPLREQLAFKGGTAIKKIYVPDYRFSEDLDFTLLNGISNEQLINQVETIFPWLQREVNIKLETRKTEVHQRTGSPTLYLNYIGPLGGRLGSRFLKMDFTRDELLLFPLTEARIQTPYSDCRNRSETLQAYSMEEILAEKLCALIGRTEPRDLYDIHYILMHQLANTDSVSYYLPDKMNHKGVDHSALENVLTRKQSKLKRSWPRRLRGHMTDLPHFETVVRETNRWLRQSGLV